MLLATLVIWLPLAAFESLPDWALFGWLAVSALVGVICWARQRTRTLGLALLIAVLLSAVLIASIVGGAA